jgi:phage terminase small subunit
MNGGPLDEFGLTLKQRDFCLALDGEAKGNATEAARIARYEGNDNTLRAIGSENLTKPSIIAFLTHLRANTEANFIGKIMSPFQVKAGITHFANADIAEVFEPDGTFDLQSAKRRGVSRWIKTLKLDKDTGRVVSVELHNAHAAHVDMGKMQGLFPNKVEVSSKELEEAIARAALQHPSLVPLPPTFGASDDDAPAS